MTRVISVGKRVSGVTSLGGDVVFVVCENTHQVDVYDAANYAFRRRIMVPGFGSPLSLAACPSNNCLYMLYESALFGGSLHRVELTDGAVLEWCVARNPTGLSVNSKHNVLVTSRCERKLQEFTTRGTLLREVQLPSEIGHPWQAVQLPTGNFL